MYATMEESHSQIRRGILLLFVLSKQGIFRYAYMYVCVCVMVFLVVCKWGVLIIWHIPVCVYLGCGILCKDSRERELL
jgi:hypothetical protein